MATSTAWVASQVDCGHKKKPSKVAASKIHSFVAGCKVFKDA